MLKSCHNKFAIIRIYIFYFMQWLGVRCFNFFFHYPKIMVYKLTLPEICIRAVEPYLACACSSIEIENTADWSRHGRVTSRRQVRSTRKCIYIKRCSLATQKWQTLAKITTVGGQVDLWSVSVRPSWELTPTVYKSTTHTLCWPISAHWIAL